MNKFLKPTEMLCSLFSKEKTKKEKNKKKLLPISNRKLRKKPKYKQNKRE